VNNNKNMIINCSEKYLRIVMTEEDKNGNFNFKKKLPIFSRCVVSDVLL